MYNLLEEKLKAHILVHHPDVLQGLQESYSIATYLDDKVSKVMPTVIRLVAESKPGYVVEELAFNELAAHLRPSRFAYLQKVLEEDFPREFNAFTRDGVLTYESISLTLACKELFDNFPFTEESQEDSHLRHAVIAMISNYLN